MDHAVKVPFSFDEEGRAVFCLPFPCILTPEVVDAYRDIARETASELEMPPPTVEFQLIAPRE